MTTEHHKSSVESITVVELVNDALIRRLAGREAVVFGQNITAGSRISGLGKGLDSQQGVIAVNTPNSENSLMGFGFGLMLMGTDSAYLMKQHDFALLGLDHLTNTWNSVRPRMTKAAFIVLMVVVDSGFEGPQASLNNLDEFSSLTRCPVHFLNSRANVEAAFEESQAGGLHLMALSQTTLHSSLTDFQGASVKTAFGELITGDVPSKILIVFFGLDTAYFLEVLNQFRSSGFPADSLIFRKTIHSTESWEEFVTKYTSIVVVSTSKSEVTYAQKLALEISQSERSVKYFGRKSSERWSQVNEDQPEWSPSQIFKKWMESEHAI